MVQSFPKFKCTYYKVTGAQCMVYHWVSENVGENGSLSADPKKFRYDTSRETLLKVGSLASVVVAAIYDLAAIDDFGV